MKQLSFDPKFFNTIHLTDGYLEKAKQKTGLQDCRVLEIFSKHEKLTPFECHKIYCELYPAAPVTSIRRSITVLTRHGRLDKLPEMKTEIYGKKNHYWICSESI